MMLSVSEIYGRWSDAAEEGGVKVEVDAGIDGRVHQGYDHLQLRPQTGLEREAWLEGRGLQGHRRL